MPDKLLLLKPETPPRKRSIWLPTLALVVLAAVCTVGIRWLESRVQSRILVFDRGQNQWRQLPSPGKYPDDLLVSPNGTAWSLSLIGLSRWDGKSWRVFQPDELGLRTSVPHGGFALDGDELWAASREGVVHWDGRTWRSYPEAATSGNAAVAAAGGEVWVIDGARKLSHFASGRWESHMVTLPGFAVHPALALTSNGQLWLVWDGLWRLDGWKWEPVRAPTFDLNDAHLVGSTGDRVWLWDSEGLRTVSSDGRAWQLFSPKDLGLPSGVNVQSLAVLDKNMVFATTAGLLHYDGSAWQNLPSPSSGAANLGKVSAGPKNEIWALGLPPLNSLHGFDSLLPGVGVIAMLILAAALLAFARFNGRQIRQHQRVTEAVAYATGEIPYGLQRAEQRLSWQGRVSKAFMFAGTLGGYLLLRRRWPDAPVWTAPLIAALTHLAFTFQRSLVKRKAKDPRATGSHPRFDWAKTGKIFAGGLLILVLYNTDRLPQMSLLRGFAIWIVLLTPIGYNALMLHLMEKAGRATHYDGALAVVRRFHFFNPNGMLPLRLSGHILLQAGRYPEAEQKLRGGLASALGGEDYGFALENLGETLMEQGRYEEASRSYEAALHAVVWLRRPYRGMAEMLLRRGQNAAEALELSERILDVSGMSWRERKANGRSEHDYWGLKAWALAELGRAAEVLPAVENAVKSTDKSSRPDLATTHYRAGMAMLALGSDTAAARHFNLAMELDPAGRRGTLAKYQLDEMDAYRKMRWREARA
jgi:tetratricopeptide (TPR) repeat protein